MGKGCSVPGCNGVHYAKTVCRYHYVMPSRSLANRCITSTVVDTKANKALNRPKNNQKTVNELIKLADIVFARWIKNRDKLNDRTFKCISCGLFKPIREAQCGHFFSRTFSFLRYNEDNSHLECETDNCFNDQHLIGYEVHLKEKIGLERFNFLLDNYNRPHKWDRQELLNLIAKYK